jgi:hypothetical protein
VSGVTEFIGEPIEIKFERTPWHPTAFVWRDREHAIARVLDAWFDFGWGTLKPRPKRWWQRRHRTYYRVETEAGEVFEIYHDRARREWTLYRRLEFGEEDLPRNA